MQLGIIGTGHIATFLCRGLRASGWQGVITISPHNASQAEAFSEQFDASIAVSNQQVIDQSSIVLLSVRSVQYENALSGLIWNSGAVLLSVMAGVTTEVLRKVVGEQVNVVRSMPISAAEIGQSPTLLFPDHSAVEALFSRVGSVITLESEIEFEAATVNAAVYGWHFALIAELVKVNMAAGLSADQSKEIVTRTLSAASAVAAQTDVDASALIQSLATPGGITAEGLSELSDREAIASWSIAFDRVLQRLQSND